MSSPSWWNPCFWNCGGVCGPRSVPIAELMAVCLGLANRRWAAKEAVYKAVGGYRLLFPEIEVVAAAAAGSDEVVRMPCPVMTLPLSGFGPRIKLHGASRVAAESLGVEKVLLSLSHDDATIFAVAAVLEAQSRS